MSRRDRFRNLVIGLIVSCLLTGCAGVPGSCGCGGRFGGYPAFNAPSTYGAPGGPTLGTPTYSAPTYGAPTYGAPTYGAPGSNLPTLGDPQPFP